MLKQPPALYRDPTAPLQDRVADLLTRMTIHEKCSQLLADSPAIDRLGIPAYHWWNECLHGVARAGRAVVYPQAIGLAATFDPGLIERMGLAIADEARAKFNTAVSVGNRRQYRGLTFWTPNVNIFRDPRWGRGHETYGEDPYLSGEIGAAFVRGLQTEKSGYLKAAACAKHFAVHSGPEILRHEFDAVVSQKDLRETYLPAFRRLVDEGVEAVMGAYNRVNGEPACASSTLIRGTLREVWGFGGHVVSDCGAIGDIHDHHKVTANARESAALAVRAGCDLNCGSTYEALPQALEDGLLSVDDIDRCLSRLLSTRFRLGLLDSPEHDPFASIGADHIRPEESVVLAREAAEESVVLLKNNGVLPIVRASDPKRIYLVGHNAASVDVLLGNYFGVSDRLVTVLEGLVGMCPDHFEVEYRLGMLADRPNVNAVDWSTPNKWDSFDVAIAVVGLVPMLEGEEGEAILSSERGDRTSLDLPPHQVTKLNAIKDAGLPLVVIVAGGSPVNLSEVHEFADAVLFMWYPGEQGGNALARILFGEIAPSGKLPVTFPESVDQLPPFEDYRMDGRTYRFMSDAPLYPFGFGLSYTQFEYSNAAVATDSLAVGQSVTASAVVRNTGAVEGDEVVQCYLTDVLASVRVPRASLCGFLRIRLKPQEATTVSFVIPADAMAIIWEDGSADYEPGEFVVTIGSCSPGDRGVQLGAAPPVQVQFQLESEYARSKD